MKRVFKFLVCNYLSIIILILCAITILLYLRNKSFSERIQVTEKFLIENYSQVAHSTLRDSLLFSKLPSDVFLIPYKSETKVTFENLSTREYNIGMFLSKFSCDICVDTLLNNIRGLFLHLPYLENLVLITDVESPNDIKVVMRKEGIDWPIMNVDDLSSIFQGNRINIPILLLWDRSQRIIGLYDFDVKNLDQIKNNLTGLSKLF